MPAHLCPICWAVNSNPTTSSCTRKRTSNRRKPSRAAWKKCCAACSPSAAAPAPQSWNTSATSSRSRATRRTSVACTATTTPRGCAPKCGWCSITQPVARGASRPRSGKSKKTPCSWAKYRASPTAALSSSTAPNGWWCRSCGALRASSLTATGAAHIHLASCSTPHASCRTAVPGWTLSSTSKTTCTCA